MHIEPYLFFEGRCEEALNFYQAKIGAEVTMLMRFKDSPDPEACPPGAEENVMHAVMRVGDSTVMVSDGQCDGYPSFQGFSLSIAISDSSEAEQLYNALCDGGEAIMPLAKTFWSPSFGMVKDKFGVSWMIGVMK